MAPRRCQSALLLLCRMKRSSLLFALAVSTAQADWRADAGFFTLQTELGGSMPTGAGIPIMMSEASTTFPTITYLPQATAGTTPFAGAGSYAGKTFTPHSGASSSSFHADIVCSLFCGNSSSLSPGVTDVHAWLADDFAIGLLDDPVPSWAGSVQNHSWAGTTESVPFDIEIMRRMDFMIDRDAVPVTTPLINGATMANLLGQAYNSIAVGVRSGNHPHSGTTLDGAGRMKPDLVVDHVYTSQAGPSVASAATLLLDVIRPAYPDADDPRVVKAILIAAASKDRLLGWTRATTAKPYDVNFGAGELNILNAHHILTAARQAASDITERSARGWDIGISSTASTQRYFFSVPPGKWANTFSAALTWHRQTSAPFTSYTLANMNLRLAKATALTPGATVDQSISSVDNVEHVFLRNLPSGEYVLEVTADTSALSFGLAWEAQIGDGPRTAMTRSGSVNTLAFSGLDPLETYSLQSSSDLINWTTQSTFRTADTTPSTTHSWSQTIASGAKFYRLSWTL
jgi:hypothetical protein